MVGRVGDRALNDGASRTASARPSHTAYAIVNYGSPCPERERSTAELSPLYVQERFTCQGIGSALLAHAENLVVGHTGNPLWLSINTKNVRAMAFYEAHGYTKIGVSQFRLGNADHENNVLVAPGA